MFVGKNFNDARQFYTALLLNSSKPKQLENGNKYKPKETNSSAKTIDEDGFQLVTTKRKKKNKKWNNWTKTNYVKCENGLWTILDEYQTFFYIMLI